MGLNYTRWSLTACPDSWLLDPRSVHDRSQVSAPSLSLAAGAGGGTCAPVDRWCPVSHQCLTANHRKHLEPAKEKAKKERCDWFGEGKELSFTINTNTSCVCVFPHILVWGSSFLSLIPPPAAAAAARHKQHRDHTHRDHTHTETTHTETTHTEITHTQITHTEITHTEITHTEITHTETTTQRSHTQRSHTPRPHIPRQHAQRSHTPGSVRGSGGCLVGAGRLWSGVGASDAVPL